MHPGLLDMLHDPADDGSGWIGREFEHRGPRVLVRLEIRDHVDVDLDRVPQEPVDQDRRVLEIAGPDRRDHVPLQGLLVVAGLHAATAENVARSDQNRVADAGRDVDRLERVCDPVLRLHEPQFVEHRLEAIAILGEIDRVEPGADDGTPAATRPARVQRSLTAVLHDAADHSPGAIGAIDSASIESLDDVEHVLQGEWLEEELIARVVVGRDGLGVRVDHHRLEVHLLRREARLTAAVVELDALADAVRAAAEDHDLGAIADPGRSSSIERTVPSSARIQLPSP